MTKTYAQLMKQIEALQADADKARKREIDGVVGRIREAIAAYQLTAADLGFGTSPKAAAKPAKAVKTRRRKGSAAPKSPAVVKYANGTGGTWGGRGKRPQWLRDAINAGKSLADFAVK